jgi:hypothetical protein
MIGDEGMKINRRFVNPITAKIPIQLNFLFTENSPTFICVFVQCKFIS